MKHHTSYISEWFHLFFFFQAEDGIRDDLVTWSSDVCSSDLSVTDGATEYSSRLASGARSRRWISAVPLPCRPIAMPDPDSRAAARPICPRSTVAVNRTTRPYLPFSSRPARPAPVTPHSAYPHN